MVNNAVAHNQIKKLHIEKSILFAINHIPQIDSLTLKLFLTLLKTGGEAGIISHEEILRKMQQLLKYIPGACPQTMLILIDLLEIKPPRCLALNTVGWLQAGDLPHEQATLFVEAGGSVEMKDKEPGS